MSDLQQVMIPLGDRVLVRILETEEKTAGGLYIPDTAKEKPTRGIIVGIGDGPLGNKKEIEVGDTVMFGRYSGMQVALNGVNHALMKEEDLLGKLL